MSANGANTVNHQVTMVKKQLKNLVNVAPVSNRRGGMLLRVAIIWACGLGAGILGTGCIAAEDLGPEQASAAFVVGKLFSYNCFDGTAWMGRIFSDGSIIGTIRIRGEGEARFAALPPGTIRVDGPAICAHLSGLLIRPCFKVQKIDRASFRGSITGLDFAYCDFYERNPRAHSISKSAEASPTVLPLQSSHE